jgi:hypothetical protein
MGRRAGILNGKGQMNALDEVQNTAAKFAYHRNDSNWEKLTQRRKISHIYALFKGYMGERAWKALGVRLERTEMIGKLEAESKRQISGKTPL